MAKTKPQPPIPPKLSTCDQIKLGLMAVAQPILWGAMILAGFHILISWVYIALSKGFFDPTTIQYSVLVAVGAYFCLILDKDKVDQAMKIKRDLPFIKGRDTKTRKV